MKNANNKYGFIDQVWRQDGWILAKFFFLVFINDQDGVKVDKLLEKEQGLYPAIFNNRKSLVNKEFISWLSGKFFLQNTADSPEGAR